MFVLKSFSLLSCICSPGQQDPTQESREVQEGIFEVLNRGADVSVRILEQLLGAGEVRGTFLYTSCNDLLIHIDTKVDYFRSDHLFMS